jgi:thioredoxin 1
MASKNVVNLNTANWDAEVVKSEQPVLVDFWAVWCGPCRMLSPTIDKLADQFAGKAKICKLNTDESPEIAAQYGIASIPQVLFFKGGADPKERIVGVNAENAYVKTINRLLEA